MGTSVTTDVDEPLKRITFNPDILGGKPVIRGRRYAVEHVLMQLAVGNTPDDLLEGHDWLEREDLLACIAYAFTVVRNERFMPRYADSSQ